MEHPTLPAPALRGRVVGAVCAFGAALAHLAAGGTVTPAALVLVVIVSVGLAPLVLRRGLDPAATFALALVVQVVWHAAWSATSASSAAPSAAAAHSGVAMLLTHLLAALASTASALAVEHELLAAARRALGRLCPPVRREDPAVLPTGRGPGSQATAGADRRPVGRAGAGAVRALRAPPGRTDERALASLARA